MQVVKIDKKTGEYHTKYLFPEKIAPNALYRKYGSYKKMPARYKKSLEHPWINDKKNLHDPNKFDIEIPKEPKK